MKLDLRSLLAGEIRSLAVDFQLPLVPDAEDLTSPLYGVTFPQPVSVSGEIVNTAGYVRMSLSVTADYETACARCLCPVGGVFRLPVERTVLPPRQFAEIDADKEEEYVTVENGFLDVDDLLLELFELNFPTKFLCREDCRGLCPQCGADLNLAPCQCEDREPDPRLAPLQKILADLKAAETDPDAKK